MKNIYLQSKKYLMRPRPLTGWTKKIGRRNVWKFNLQTLRKAGRFLLIFMLISGWLFSGFPQFFFESADVVTPEGRLSFGVPPKAREARAATVNIRQEINII